MTDSSQSPNAPKEVLEQIADEYENTFVIPKRKPVPQWMLMPVGLIGSGKTTVIKPLAAHFGLVRISNEVRERLKQHGYSYEGARDITHELAQKYLRLGYSIAIDGNTGSQFGLEYNKKTAMAFPQVRQLFIHINPPDDFIINKLKNYRHTWLFKDGKHAVERFRFHQKGYVLPDIDFVFTLDPSRSDLNSQLKQCIEAIENSLR